MNITETNNGMERLSLLRFIVVTNEFIWKIYGEIMSPRKLCLTSYLVIARKLQLHTCHTKSDLCSNFVNLVPSKDFPIALVS